MELDHQNEDNKTLEEQEYKKMIDEIELKPKKVTHKKRFQQYVLITIGVIILDIAFYFFLEPANIVSGGTMGLSIVFTPIINKIFPWFTNSTFLYLVDFIALIMGLIFLGKDFFLKTIYATILSPSVILLFEHTMDPRFFVDNMSEGVSTIIVSLIVGSLLVGIGVGLAIKNHGSTGGMDVFQKILNIKLKVPMSVTIYMTDWVIVLLAGFVKNAEFTYIYQLEHVVYGSIGVFIQAFVIDFIVMSARIRRTVYVITDKPLLIKELIYNELDRGVTFSSVVGAYTNIERTMVICTMDKNEAYKITDLIAKLEPNAFTFVTSCKEVRGEYDKRGIIW